MKYKKKLLQSLKSLELSYNISVWHDGEIGAGHDIDEAVLQNLNNAHIVLLLVTPAFIASYYCMRIELQRAIERKEKGECIVIPVIYEHSVLLEEMPFYSLKRIPTDGKPISKFRPQQDGCTEVVNFLKAEIDETFPKYRINTRRNVKKASIPKEMHTTINLYKGGGLKPIEVNQGFIDILPEYHSKILEFMRLATQVVDNHVTNYQGCLLNIKDIEKVRVECFRLFLMDLCVYIKKYVTDTVGIRIHFRALKHDQYVGLIASTERGQTDDLATNWRTELTPIPIYNGLIYHSRRLKAPLLKTLNHKLNHKCANDSKWKEYLTYAFTDIDSQYGELLSIGISLRDKYYKEKKETFLVLAYLGFTVTIEKVILHYFKRCKYFDSRYNIHDIVENL